MQYAIGSVIVLGFLVTGLTLLFDASKRRAEQKTDYAVVCLDAVSYWTKSDGYRGYLAPKYNTDGTVSICDE